MTSKRSFQMAVGSLISSTSSVYEVQDILGSGAFGEVTQCRKVATDETVALKVIRRRKSIEEAKAEVVSLKKMKELGSENFNIVRWNDSFTFEGRYCLEFEKLDINLYEFQQSRRRKSLKLKEIRPIMQQLATALEFLKSAGIVHADLKSENIMMVDHLRQPLKIKVIDFGLACHDPEAWRGATVQTLWYRAPEVLLGAPFGEAIDVWSLGCIAAELLAGKPLLPGDDEYDMMRHIVDKIAQPPDNMLNEGLYTRQFFHPGLMRLWRFKLPFKVEHPPCRKRKITCLNDLMKASRKPSEVDARADTCDQASFVELLTKMLQVDAADRITASQILQHPFVTMSHLVDMLDNSLHVKSCAKLMTSCQGQSSDDGEEEAQEEASNIPASQANDPNEGCPALQGWLKSIEELLKAGPSPSDFFNTKKRKRDDEEEEASPDKRRDEFLDAAGTEIGGQTSPQTSPLLKRKNDKVSPFIPSEGSSLAKESEDLNMELLDSMNELLNAGETRPTPSHFFNMKKKKRADEEEEASPGKRRKGCLDEGEGPTHLKDEVTKTSVTHPSSQTHI